MRVDALSYVEVLPVAVRTASANGSAVAVNDYVNRVAFTLMSAAMSTGDTLDVKLQDSADGSTGWADISGAAFTQVTPAADATETIYLDIDSVKQYVRAVVTIAGDGSESVACGVLMTAAAQNL